MEFRSYLEMIIVTASIPTEYLFSSCTVHTRRSDVSSVYLAIKISLVVLTEISTYLTALAHGHVFIFSMHDLTALETPR